MKDLSGECFSVCFVGNAYDEEKNGGYDDKGKSETADRVADGRQPLF